jgi:hypothetical protein
MTEHDVWDEGSELSELRELHRQDRMPADLRERLIRRVRAPSSLAHDDAGHDGVDASSEEQARPRAVPALLGESRRSARGASSRRAAYGLGASALVAAAVALSIGTPSLRFGAEPQRASLDSKALSELVHESNDQAASGDPNQAEMRVVGWLIVDSLRRLDAPPEPGAGCRYGFRLSPLSSASNAVLRVETGRCSLPEPLINAGGSCVKVTANGYLGDDGHLEASRVMAEYVHCQP